MTPSRRFWQRCIPFLAVLNGYKVCRNDVWITCGGCEKWDSLVERLDGRLYFSAVEIYNAVLSLVTA